jgi:hypothetical protein
MSWAKKFLTEKMAVAVSLFLIGSLHTMIFSFFEYPTNFFVHDLPKNTIIALKAVLYISAVIVSFSHQFLCRNIGLKISLAAGLFCNLLGLGALWVNHFVAPHISLLFFTMVLFGVALTSVINVLITYLIIEIPKYLGPAIVVLFCFFNIGAMLAPLMIHLFKKMENPNLIYHFLSGLSLVAIWFVWRVLDEPVYPRHLQHLRKGSLIWKELHYRLGLFFLALLGYGVTENTFNLWGFQAISEKYTPEIAEKAVSAFWLFLIIGQVTLLIPIFIFAMRWIYYILLSGIVATLVLLAQHESLAAFLSLLMIGGFCCSVNSPLLISIMEKEISLFASGSRLLPYVETTVSVLIAGYFIGVGIIDLWVEIFEEFHIFTTAQHFYFAIPFIFCTAVFSFYLLNTRPSAR